MTPAGQRWTRERPTEPGWYWYRDEDGLFVMSVFFYNRKNCCMASCSSGDWPLDNLDGEWQGPLTPNEATE